MSLIMVTGFLGNKLKKICPKTVVSLSKNGDRKAKEEKENKGYCKAFCQTQ